MTDRFDEMAKTLTGGLHECTRAVDAPARCRACKFVPYLATALRDFAASERAAETERCAGIADQLEKDFHASYCYGEANTASEIAAAIRARPILWTQSADSTREDQVWTASANGVDLRVVYEYNDYERGGSVDCVIAWTAVTSSKVYGPFDAPTLPDAKSAAEEFARKMAR